MVNVWALACSHAGCCKTASYGVAGTTAREFCTTHKQVDMVNLMKKLCAHPACHATPAYATVGSSRAEFCENHAAAGMVNVRRSRCAYPDCTKLGVRGEDGKSKAFCALHVNRGAGVVPALAAAVVAEAARKNPNESTKRGRLSAAAADTAPVPSPRVTRLSVTGSGGGIAKRFCGAAPRQQPPPKSLAVTGSGSSSHVSGTGMPEVCEFRGVDV